MFATPQMAGMDAPTPTIRAGPREEKSRPPGGREDALQAVGMEEFLTIRTTIATYVSPVQASIWRHIHARPRPARNQARPHRGQAQGLPARRRSPDHPGR